MKIPYRRKCAGFLVLLLLTFWLIPAYAVQPDEMLSDPKLEARAREIGAELRCLVCQNESIDDSNAPLAHDLRVLLRQRLAAGDKDDAARQYLVARYGDYVLLKPPLKISTLMLWFGPLLLLLAALGAAAGFYRNRKDNADDPADAARDMSTITKADRRATRRLIYIVAPLILLAAGLLYAYLGAPELPDRPYAARQNDPDFRLNAAAESIAIALEKHPDAEGYKRLAGMFYALHRYDRAADAARAATELDPKDADSWSQLGESLVMQNDGAVPMEAVKAFQSALKIDPADPRARFYIGIAETEIGNLKKAVAIWRDLEQSAPPGAPWLPMVQKNTELYAKQGGFDPDSITPAPPVIESLPP